MRKNGDEDVSINLIEQTIGEDEQLQYKPGNLNMINLKQIMNGQVEGSCP